MNIFVISLFLFFVKITNSLSKPCNPRHFNHDSIVCVCSDSYCDTIDPISPTPSGIIKIYESDRAGKRLEQRELKFGNDFPDSEHNFWELIIQRTEKFQEIIGFGGAWSDAAAIGLHNLNPELRTKVLRSYFSNEGIEYSTARVVISGSDFSNRPYTYDDVDNDWNLTKWSLVREDVEMKIPQMQEALIHANKSIKFFGSSWSPPAFMKTNRELNHGGQLIGKAGSFEWKQYARYLVKFFTAYRSVGLDFWGMTVQNEPMTGWEPWFLWNTCAFDAEMERDFVREDLGPIFEQAGFPPSNFNILVLDHNRPLAKDWANTVFSDSGASRYVTGIGVHWYFYGTSGPYNVYDKIHTAFPTKLILGTEACNRGTDENDRIALGLWRLGEEYGHDILLNLLHWVSGWTDWNLVLDLKGGPNWVSNFHSSPIIVNVEKGEFYKNPQFYALAHFSKFLPPGSFRIGTDPKIEETGSLELGAFERPDGGTVIIVVNSSDLKEYFSIIDPELGHVKIKVDAHTISTWIYYR